MGIQDHEASAVAPEPQVRLTVQVGQQVADALELLEYAMESGFKREDGSTVPPETVAVIKVTAAKLMVTEAWEKALSRIPEGSDPERPAIAASEWVAFELAYHRLATVMSPITVHTLRNTDKVGGWLNLLASSPAQHFTRLLWLVALCFAAFVVLGEWGMQRYGPVLEGNAGPENTMLMLVQILVPYAYGGLGSCVYLLRSAHQYIYERTFDLRRKPEYLNRVLLGTIGGGAIILFAEHVTADNGEVIGLSSAALGFLAGYSTDFLFSAIERIIGALLPKIDLGSVRRAKDAPRPPPVADLSSATLTDLMDRFDKATSDNDKKLYQSLIEKLRDRI